MWLLVAWNTKFGIKYQKQVHRLSQWNINDYRPWASPASMNAVEAYLKDFWLLTKHQNNSSDFCLYKNRLSFELPRLHKNKDREDRGRWWVGGRKGVINVSQTQCLPSRQTLLSSVLSFTKSNDTPVVFLFAPALLSLECLCRNFEELGLWGLAAGYGCGQGSSGFTQGRMSPRGDRKMSASVNLCLSSKPRQQRLSALHHGSVAPSFLTAYDLRHPGGATGFAAPSSPPHSSSAPFFLRCWYLTWHNKHKVKVSVMFRSVSVNALQLLPVHESRACHLACVRVRERESGCFEWQCEWGAARRRLFVRVHLPPLPISPSRQQTVTADSPHKRRKGKGGRGYGD